MPLRISTRTIAKYIQIRTPKPKAFLDLLISLRKVKQNQCVGLPDEL